MPASGPCLFEARFVGAAIADDRQAQRGETRGLAIGIDDESLDLRGEAASDTGDERHALDRQQRLVGAHPRRAPAGEDHAQGRFAGHVGRFLSGAGEGDARIGKRRD